MVGGGFGRPTMESMISAVTVFFTAADEVIPEAAMAIPIPIPTNNFFFILLPLAFFCKI